MIEEIVSADRNRMASRARRRHRFGRDDLLAGLSHVSVGTARGGATIVNDQKAGKMQSKKQSLPKLGSKKKLQKKRG